MKRQTKAYVHGLAAVGLWSTVASAFKVSLSHLDPVQLVLYASIFSTLSLAVVLGVTGKLRSAFAVGLPELRRSVVLGLINPCLYYLILFAAYDRLPAQEAQPLNYTWAITLAIMSVLFLGQKWRLSDMAATAISYLGVVIIATRGDVTGLHFSNPWGVFFALISTILWAGYWIAATRDDRDPVVGLFLNFLMSLPFSGLICLLWSSPVVTSWSGVLSAAYVGFFEMGLTFVLWGSALKLSESAAKVGNLIFISPFLSLVFIHFIVGETIAWSTLIGLVCIMVGLAVQHLGHHRA
nr:DMT family transporter [Desulfovibrio inopinatus]